VHGNGTEEDGQKLSFDSYGMDFDMAKSVIILPKEVKVMMEKKALPPETTQVATSPSPTPNSVPDITTILSDHAVILRNKQLVHFTMYPSRPIESRFVHITQPTLFTRGRRADLNYGSSSKLLQYMTAFDDVLVKETGKKEEPGVEPSLKYATGGRADFDNRSDVVRMTLFPQAYQDNDTVTGDIILLHRDSDLVEVEHSNAFSQGN
jgi:hypothetical protein